MKLNPHSFAEVFIIENLLLDHTVVFPGQKDFAITYTPADKTRKVPGGSLGASTVKAQINYQVCYSLRFEIRENSVGF